MIFRLIWMIVTVLAVGLFVIGLPARHAQLQVVSFSANTRVGELLPSEAQALVDLGLSPTFYANYFTLLEAISALPFLLVAAVLFWRKANERVVFLISITGILVGTMAIPVAPALVSARPEWETPVLVLRNVAILGLITQFFVFPDGRFVPGWTRWAAYGWGAYLLAATFVPSLAPPVGLAGLGPQDIPVMIWLFIWMGLGAYAQIFRYRFISTPIQRQQTKYVVLGMVVSFTLAFLAFLINYLGESTIPSPVVAMQLRLLSLTFTLLITLPVLPLSVALSILRYRLWDIDLIIRRTLVYGLLTALLGLVYFGSVVVLQALFTALMGEQSTVAIVLSTLGIAALFTPLRSRVQAFIDRRFYRQRYNSEQVLAAFAEQARQETDLEALTEGLMGVVGETMQPEGLSLWINGGERQIVREG
jgi:hypothetical protein